MASRRAELYHSLSVMLESGLPVLRALELAARTARGKLGRGVRSLAEAAGRGEGLAETMAQSPHAFSPLEVMIVEAAETAGRLPDSLEHLASYYALQDQLRRTILSGLGLPVVILHAAALVIPCPPLVLGQIGLGTYLFRMLSLLAIFYVPAGIILAIVWLTPKTGPLRRLLDGFTLRIPVLGRAMRQLALSRFTRAFQMLYACGTVPMAECVSKAADTAGNVVVRRWLSGGIRTAKEGHPVSEGFSSQLPVEFVESWRVGEEAGALDTTAVRLADASTEDSRRLFERLAVWLPRLVYFLVCIFLIYHIFKGFANIYGGYSSVLE